MTTVPAGKTQATQVLDIIVDHYGWQIKTGFYPRPEVRMDFDWFGYGPQATIVWEQGPEDWTLEVLEALRDKQPPGVWCEPGTSWFLHVYQEI